MLSLLYGPTLTFVHDYWNWSIVDLQCCVCFRYTVKWFTCAYMCILFFFQIISSCRLSPNIEYSSWCYTVGPCWLSILYIIVCIGSEKAMATHSSTLAWKIPWTEEPSRLQSMGLLRVGHDWATSLSCTGEGNGNPLQCFSLENPRDGGAWWAAVCGVAQSQTRLKWLSSTSSSSVYRLIPNS